MKRNTCKRTLLVLVNMVLGAIYAFAVNQAPWNGTSVAPKASGNTYLIRTAEELAWVAQKSQTDDFTGLVIRIEADIDLGGTQEQPFNWTPIGNEAHPFNGELDGNNHVVYNLYLLSSLFPKGAGLIAEAGTKAVIHNLGLAQGQIMTDATNNVGSLVGINRGQINHCFNMMQLIVHGGNNVGGLVGINEGTISYCYNAGIITDAGSNVGGLVGYNKATARLNECYNMAYCKGSDRVGALFGTNEAPEEQLTQVCFDQQLTLVYATGSAGSDKILKDNTKYAIEKSRIFASVESPFYDAPEWYCACNENSILGHPQLLCFKDHPASQLSVKAIGMDETNTPIMRAEGVGAPTESNEPRNSITLEAISSSAHGKGKWHSPSPDVIYIRYADGGFGEIRRPCGNQEVILTLSYANFVKQIYTIVKGYETFDAGYVGGHAYACWMAEDAGFKDANKEGKEPTGGKDDEQKNESLSYQYRIIRDTVIKDGDNLTFITLDTFRMSYEAYIKWCMPADVPGEYAFRREVRDMQCKTEWTPSGGYLFFTVRKEFDPGELFEKPDTMYGVLPLTLEIRSCKDASGGSEVFTYKWVMERSEWNKDSLDWTPVPDDKRNPLYIDGTAVNTSSFDYTFTKPGKYTFKRSVQEESCTSAPMDSKHVHVVYVYEAINPGAIENYSRALCTASCNDTITEQASVSGGNGIYSYRWLCNGEPLSDSDTIHYCIAAVPMEEGNTYVFTRQVKDNTGLMDWTDSRGKVTVTVFGPFTPGAITSSDEHVCTGSGIPRTLSVHIQQMEPAQGDQGSQFAYCWLLYSGSIDTKPLDTLRYDTPSLDEEISLSAYGLKVPVSLLIKRAVKNTLCESDWILSDGTAAWRYGKEEKKTETVSICAGQMPYDYNYTFADGTEQTFRFTTDAQTYSLQDLTDEGCLMDVVLVSEVIPMPDVEIAPLHSVCQTASHLNIAFTVLNGQPDYFDLTFDHNSLEAGFRDSIHVPLPDTPAISIPLPDRVPLGKRTLALRFYTDDPVPEDCRSTVPQTMNFSIDLDGYVQRKGQDIVFVDNSGRNTSDGLTFVSYRWYRDGVLLYGENDQFIHEYPALDGVYQVEMITEDGTVYRSCMYEMRPATPIDSTRTEEQKRIIFRNGQVVLLVRDEQYTLMGEKIRL